MEYQHNVHHHKKSGSGGDFTALIAGNAAMAADVPAGVQLAEKQTLVRNNGAEVQSLDPHKIEGVPESNVNRDLFEGLLVTDVDGHPAPGVAEKWDNKDFKVWTFHLRKDAKWSDGTPVTAEDFVYSWQRLADQIPPPRMRVTSSMAILPISMTSSRVKASNRHGRKSHRCQYL